MKLMPALAVAFALLASGPLHAAPKDEQVKARKELRAGNILRIRDIEGKVLPVMNGAQYLGPEYDPAAMAYRLKFIREGRVIFVDVDARTGHIIRQSR